MNGSDLKRTIKFNTPEASYHSLPFVLKTNNGNEIGWFVYDIKKINDTKFIEIESVCSLGNHSSITVREKSNVIVDFCELSTLTNKDDKEYYDNFMFFFNNNEFDAIEDLLNKYESEDCILLYSALLMLEEV